MLCSVPEELVNYMGATPTEFPTRDACGLSAQDAPKGIETVRALGMVGGLGV